MTEHAEHDRLAVTHEPPPTGEGAVVLEFAVKRVEAAAIAARGRGNPSLYDQHVLVACALRERAEMGRAKYGTYLRVNNGRNALVDLYQELLDAIMYAEQCNMEAHAEMETSRVADPRLLVGAGCLDELIKLAARVGSQIAKAAF